MNDYEIEQLIPQRAPVRMVDKLLEADENTGLAALTIQPDNYFLDDAGNLSEAGLIEHIAQSASALSGYQARIEGETQIPTGYIGEIRDFRCFRYPHVGEELRTTITQDGIFGDILCISGETRIVNEPVAELRMKIQIRNNS